MPDPTEPDDSGTPAEAPEPEDPPEDPPAPTEPPTSPENPPDAPPETPAPPKSLQDLILESAAEPKSATVDGQNVQSRDLRELIEAERFLASKKAARRPGGGIRITQMTHSGPT